MGGVVKRFFLHYGEEKRKERRRKKHTVAVILVPGYNDRSGNESCPSKRSKRSMDIRRLMK